MRPSRPRVGPCSNNGGKGLLVTCYSGAGAVRSGAQLLDAAHDLVQAALADVLGRRRPVETAQTPRELRLLELLASRHAVCDGLERVGVGAGVRGVLLTPEQRHPATRYTPVPAS